MNQDSNIRLKVLGTGSSGNCYLLETEKETLMIECGLTAPIILQGLDYDINKVAGCIVTHEHNDHARAIHGLINWGVDVYATKGTLESTNATNSTYSHVIEEMGKYSIGGFSVMPFPTIHDAAEPVGFLIHHEKCGLVLFLTDTAYSEYKFQGLNNIIVEANYDMRIIKKRMDRDSNLSFLKDRVINSHLNIDNCLNLLKANDLSEVNNIVLIHLSDGNSDEADFKRRVEESTGKNVSVAVAGMDIDFGLTPF